MCAAALRSRLTKERRFALTRLLIVFGVLNRIIDESANV